jgi:hypothetical protein
VVARQEGPHAGEAVRLGPIAVCGHTGSSQEIAYAWRHAVITHALATCTVRQFADELRARRLSSRELLDAYLTRIDQLGPPINAVVTLDRERAYAAAGDWGAVWDMLSGAGRDAMSRSDYVAVVSRCPKVYPNDTVRSITLSGNKTAATITSDSVGGGTYQWTLLYQNSHWRRQPSDGALHWMKLGRSGALAFLAPC